MARPKKQGVRCIVCGRTIKPKEAVVNIGKGLVRHATHRTNTIVKAYVKLKEEKNGRD